MSPDQKLSVDFTTLTGERKTAYILGLPDRCPACGKGISPIVLGGRQTASAQLALPKCRIIFYFQCPVKDCFAVFLAPYTESKYQHSDYYLGKYGILCYRSIETFPDSVSTISPKFVLIYRQARIAEENGLGEVAGCGFRRSLEFLVKDYLIHESKGDAKTIETTKSAHLADCIKKIDDERIRVIAKQATWLGNDETHYLKKFEDFDLQNLKELIKLTAYWIDANEIAKKYEEKLPPN